MEGYQVEQELYCGGKSLVYKAKRNADDASVILKILNKEYPNPDELARFRTEFEFTKKLEGKGIIVVHELIEHDTSLVIVLEDFGGVSLSKRLAERKLTIREFLKLAIPMTEALGQVHAQNILHKDINPSNVVWNEKTDAIKVIDFGISAELPRENPQVKSPSTLEGTLPYMSPEQTGRMNRAMDYRTDLYSLGVTFYEMLMGFRPFDANDPMELVHCHIAKAPKAPHELDKKIPIPLSNLIVKLLAKNAEDRYQTTFGLMADLRECKKQMDGHGRVVEFELGQQDASRYTF